MISDQQLTFRFAVAATFTAEPLRRVISFWGGPLHSSFEVRFAPYDQVHQTLLDPVGEFARNTRGANIVLVRLEDLGTEEAQIEANVRALLDDLRTAAAGLHVPILFCLCPPSPAFTAAPARVAFAARQAAAVGAALDETPGVHYLHHEEVDRCYPIENKHDERGEKLGHIPYTEAWFCALATALVRRTHALLRPPFKLIALDCDNTLWQGICGEDGPEGVVLDPPRRELHEFMLDQREAGALLALASKNNEEDVLETFRLHPEMPLQPRHFTTWRLDWDAKTSGLVSIAEQLGIGTDSFLFVDDNAKECAEVKQSLPEVVTLPLPEDVGQIGHFLRHVWAFDRPTVTEEDRNRSAYYEQTAGFGDEIRKAGSLEEFMASLNLRVAVTPLESARLARAAQLTQRTNQFNTTTIRRTEQAIQNLQSTGWRIWTAEASDRFGDYGVVGLVIVERLDGRWRIDSMMLSCRALGRGVEHHILSAIAEEAENVTFEIPYRRTPKSAPARQFLESIKGADIEKTEEGFLLRASSDLLRGLRWRPPKAAPAAVPRASAHTAATARTIDYAAIATQLSTVPDILAAMRAPVSATDASSETERQLARIWAELLERPVVRRGDNFFDLGGHSLVAVLLLMRIRETFGIELSIDDVYTAHLTLADLAARIEAAQLANVNPEEYAALLAEIENLSDEEVRELLARESSGQF